MEDVVKLPREDLFRASMPAVEVRAAADESDMPVLTGRFAVWNQWTEINSAFEGNFMERVAPGAFKKTFAEGRSGMRALFQHGRDPQVADKPLGPIDVLREDDQGAYYEVPLLDTAYNRELVPGLKAGLYGASFRFSVVREDMNTEPERSAANPEGIPERTIREAKVMEFGPVTFPAYAGATAGVRSITDLIHDVDAVTRATPILLDDERLERARIFVSRAIPEPTRSANICDCEDGCTCDDLPERADDTTETMPEPTEAPEMAAERAEATDTPLYGGEAAETPLYGLGEPRPAWYL